MGAFGADQPTLSKKAVTGIRRCAADSIGQVAGEWQLYGSATRQSVYSSEPGSVIVTDLSYGATRPIADLASEQLVARYRSVKCSQTQATNTRFREAQSAWWTSHVDQERLFTNGRFMAADI